MKSLLWLLLGGSTAAGWAQTAPAGTVAGPALTSASWLAAMQQLPYPAQVAALRTRLRADARRTFQNDLSQAPVCTTLLTAAQRTTWEAAQRAIPDTVVHDSRVLCVVNGLLLSGPEAAVAVADAPVRAVHAIRFLVGANAAAIYGSRAAAGVVCVTVAR